MRHLKRPLPAAPPGVVRDAFEDFLALAERAAAGSKSHARRAAAFLTARAVGPIGDKEPPLLHPAPEALWEAAQPLLRAWAARLGDAAGAVADAPGAVYQFCLSASARKSAGVFYTPEPMARLVVEEAFRRLPDAAPRLVLDPACGSGRFLAAAARLLRERWGLDAEEILARVQGVEIDPFAAALARLALLRALDLPPNRADAARVREGDALLDAGAAGERRLAFAEPAPADLVVGNPPYGARISEASARRYRERYELATENFDIVSLFVEFAGRALREDGVMAYVLPHAFTRSGGYAAAREWLLRRGALAALADAGREFPEIELNTCVVVWCNAAADGETRALKAAGAGFTPLGRVPSRFYAGRRSWPIYVTPGSLAIAERLEADGAQPLESLTPLRRGATIRGLAKLLADAEPGDGAPIVRGRHIKPYANLAEMPLPGLDIERLPASARRGVLEERAVVIQNIGDRLKATLCPPGMLPIDTVNVLPCRDPAHQAFLTAYLNSAVVNQYVRDIILNRATLTVHFDAPTIGALPVRLPPENELDYFERMVAALIEEPAPELLAELEERIRGLCGLPDE